MEITQGLSLQCFENFTIMTHSRSPIEILKSLSGKFNQSTNLIEFYEFSLEIIGHTNNRY